MIREEALLVCVFDKKYKRENAIYDVEELENLVKTAGAEIKYKIVQFRENPDPSFFIGKGKIQEIKEKINKNEINLVIFGVDLLPRHTRNLEQELGVKVIDRTELIMDIFAKHARTSEAKYQVELAQLMYRLSKLKGKGKMLSRLGGGIGTRGPGEKKLEIDRRRILNRIKILKEKLKDINRSRALQSKKREELFKISLVGYTNAGKTSILNRLIKGTAKTEDALFTTLDSLTRRLYIKGIHVLVSDTVGFIKDIPVHLIHTFRSTLSVIEEADLIMNVVDISHPRKNEHIESVNNTLYEMGILQKKDILYVFNKSDLLISEKNIEDLKFSYTPNVLISAKTGENFDKLIDIIQKFILKFKNKRVKNNGGYKINSFY